MPSPLSPSIDQTVLNWVCSCSHGTCVLTARGSTSQSGTSARSGAGAATAAGPAASSGSMVAAAAVAAPMWRARTSLPCRLTDSETTFVSLAFAEPVSAHERRPVHRARNAQDIGRFVALDAVYTGCWQQSTLSVLS